MALVLTHEQIDDDEPENGTRNGIVVVESGLVLILGKVVTM